MSENKADNTIILGPSGSGKSFASAKLCSQLGKSIIILNDSKDVYSDHISNFSVGEGDWADLVDINKSHLTIVVEDLHTLKNQQKECLFNCLNYKSRHQDWSIILIAHTILGNGLFSILDFVTQVLLTGKSINLRLLKTLLRHYYYPNRNDIEREFMEIGDHHYLMLSPHKKSYIFLDENLTDSNDITTPIKLDKSKILAYFSHLGETSIYEPLLDFLLANIPQECVQVNDVSLRVRRVSGKEANVSLIDYMATLLDRDKKPSCLIIELHMYLSKRFCFPDVFVRNKMICEKLEKDK